MAKKKKHVRRKNGIARALRTPRYRMKVVPNKKRKKEPRQKTNKEIRREIDPELRCSKSDCRFPKSLRSHTHCSIHWFKLPEALRALVDNSVGHYRIATLSAADAYLDAVCRPFGT